MTKYSSKVFSFGGIQPLDLSRPVGKILNDSTHKPRGGIWLSEFIEEERTSEWAKWRLKNRFRSLSCLTLVNISEDSKILELDSLKTARKIMEEYPFDFSNDFSSEEKEFFKDFFVETIDYSRISKKYDGVFVSKSLIVESRLNCSLSELTFTYWDVASICVFNSNILEIQEVLYL